MRKSNRHSLVAKAPSELEATLLLHVRANGLPLPHTEYRFHPKRRWRMDLAWPEHKLCAEVEGGTFKTSRHTTGTGFHKDCIKYNTAVEMGWRVLRFDSKLINSGQAIECIIRCLAVDPEHDENLGD